MRGDNLHVIYYYAHMADQADADGFAAGSTYWQAKWENEPSAAHERYDDDGNII